MISAVDVVRVNIAIAAAMPRVRPLSSNCHLSEMAMKQAPRKFPCVVAIAFRVCSMAIDELRDIPLAELLDRVDWDHKALQALSRYQAIREGGGRPKAKHSKHTGWIVTDERFPRVR
jgi:hypothetical protein